MPYRRFRIHRFVCDECYTKVEYHGLRNKRAAVERLRDDGWSAHGDGEFYCPDCNTKPTPDNWEDEQGRERYSRWS